MLNPKNSQDEKSGVNLGHMRNTTGKEDASLNQRLTITERDRILLHTLARFGYVNVGDVQLIYNTGHYHRHRITTLVKNRILNRNKNVISLSAIGREKCEELSIKLYPFLHSPRQREISRNAAYVALRLGYNRPEQTSWKAIYNRWEVKAGDTPLTSSFFEMSDMYVLVLVGETRRYLVYITGDRVTRSFNKRLRYEFKKFAHTPFNRAIVIAKTKQAMEALTDETCGMVEVLKVPFTDSVIEILREYGRDDFAKEAIERALGVELKQPESLIADYEYEKDGINKKVVFLALNDLVKKFKLEEYYRMCGERQIQPERIEIICLESQARMFRGKFLLAEITPIKLMEVENANGIGLQ